MTTRKELFIIKYTELYNNLTKINKHSSYCSQELDSIQWRKKLFKLASVVFTIKEKIYSLPNGLWIAM